LRHVGKSLASLQGLWASEQHSRIEVSGSNVECTEDDEVAPSDSTSDRSPPESSPISADTISYIINIDEDGSLTLNGWRFAGASTGSARWSRTTDESAPEVFVWLRQRVSSDSMSVGMS
jgi:hypothetical protein